MPQDKKFKFQTRRDSGIYDQRMIPMVGELGRRPDGSYRYRAGQTRTKAGDLARFDENASSKFSGDVSDLGLSVRQPNSFKKTPEGVGLSVDNAIVGSRDAYNAKVMRSRLADRASAAAEAAGVRAKRGAAMRRGAMAGLGTAALSVANDSRRMPTSEEDTNDSYGMTALGGTQGTYPNQGRMSKALGVKNTKAGM